MDEEVFTPLSDVPKRFDAVLVAKMTPWKRHALASAVPSVAHIFYREATLSWPDSLAYLERLRAEMPAHSFVNEIGDEAFKTISATEVNRLLNEVSTGLCLSAEEGQMTASMEYLMAGLPVVSTPSLGGRDYCFDPDYCLIIPPDPRAIREAVESLKPRNIPASFIREGTLVKVRRERERLPDIVNDGIRAFPGPIGRQGDRREGLLKRQATWRSVRELENEILAAVSSSSLGVPLRR